MPVSIDVLLEEPSAKAALDQFLPRLLPSHVDVRCLTFQGKPDLLKQLPDRLRGYRERLRHESLWIVVLIDRDNDDCRGLKHKLEEMARTAGLTTKSAPDPTGDFVVVNRIAVEELEAWFLGDEAALIAAYPRLRPGVTRTRKIRDPDAVQGAAEALHRILQRAGYYKNLHMPKGDVARHVGAHLSLLPGHNRSPSFQAFVAGMMALADRLSNQDATA